LLGIGVSSFISFFDCFSSIADLHRFVAPHLALCFTGY
jgi:hypothetical protein